MLRSWSGTKRAVKEMFDVQRKSIQGLAEVDQIGDNGNWWTCLLLPENEAYKEGAFRLQVSAVQYAIV